MSMLPWNVSTGLNPFEDVYSPWSMSPFSRMERWNMDPMNMMDRMMSMGMNAPMRRMENELGKLISSVKDDEKSFQVGIGLTTFSIPICDFFFQIFLLPFSLGRNSGCVSMIR